MKLIFLGTNGWCDTNTGNTICIMIVTNKEYIILDAGSALYKIDQYITDEKPIYLFLSHFHLDHIIGLHTLSKFNFTQGIQIYGPEGTRDTLNAIIKKPYSLPFDELPYPIKLLELPNESISLPFNYEIEPLLHSSLTLGFRFEFGNKIITYCPDTGYCKNAVKLARNADILIAECAYKVGEENQNWPHLNPESAARLAREAKVKKLALLHFDPSRYPTIKDRKEAEIQANKVFSNSFAAMDEMKIEI